MLEPPMIPMPGLLDVGPASERIGTGFETSHTLTFKSSCELWLIRRDFLPSKAGMSTTGPAADGVFLRLLNWASALPLALVRNVQSNHAVAMMQ